MEQAARENTSANNKRIARNTIFLYTRMLLSLGVSLYTSRVVLNVLGVNDYGVYSLVAGIVSMFTFLNAAMSGATSRFITYEMGKGNAMNLRATFSSAFIIHCIIALTIVLLSETFGLWFLNHKLVIPEGRMFAANVVFQCSIISIFFTITQVPYSADIIAHEKMDIYAYVELLHVGLKLAIVFILMALSSDKLILYAIMTVGVTVLINLIYRVYCLAHYKESHLQWVWDKQLLKPMLSFSGWNMLAELGYSFRVQGSNMVLNMFFGAVVNAAGGIASTVQGILLGLIANIVMAVRPQIIKSYGAENFQRMNRLMTSSVRLNLLLVAILTVPMYVSAPYVLHLWLGEVPQYCVPFCRMLLFAIFITSVSQIVTIGIHAVGDLKASSIVRNIIYLSTPFVIYLVLKFYPSNPIIGYVIIVINQMMACLADIYILHVKLPHIQTRGIFFDYLKSIAIAVLMVLFGFKVLGGSEHSFLKLVFDVIVECVLLFGIFYAFMFKGYEREMIANAVKSGLAKFARR